MRISDWSSDVCSSDLSAARERRSGGNGRRRTRATGRRRRTPEPAHGTAGHRKSHRRRRRCRCLGGGRPRRCLRLPPLPPPSEDYHPRQIGRAHVCTHLTNAHIIYRILLVKQTCTHTSTITPST